MNSEWKFLFIFGFFVFIFVLIWPQSIILGLYLYIIPGIFLLSSFNLFVYGILFITFLWLFAFFGIRKARRASLLTLMAIIAGVPQALSIYPHLEHQKLINSDIEPNKIDRSDKIIAFVNNSSGDLNRWASSNSKDRDKWALGCDSLCQRLLFNGAYEAVIVALADGGDVLSGNIRSEARRYHLGSGSGCGLSSISFFQNNNGFLEPAGDPPHHRRGGSYRSPTAIMSARMALGECLMVDKVNLSDANLLFITTKHQDNTRSRPLERWLFVSEQKRFKRIEVIRRSEKKIFYRYTESDYVAPFPVLSIVPYGGERFDGWGFFPQYRRADWTREPKLYLEKLFDDRVRMPAPAQDETRLVELFDAALADKTWQHSHPHIDAYLISYQVCKDIFLRRAKNNQLLEDGRYKSGYLDHLGCYRFE